MDHANTPARKNNLSKFTLLLWKNCLLQKRHKFQTLIDIILPVLTFVLLAYIQILSNPVTNQPTSFPALELNTLDSLWEHFSGYPPIKERKLIFYPNNTIFERLMNITSQNLKLQPPIGINDENKLESTLVTRELIAAIHFHHSVTLEEMPNDLSYSLRFPAELRTTELPSHHNVGSYNWQTNKLYPADNFNTPNNLAYDDGGPPAYHSEGFLAIQNAIAHALISMSGNQMPDILIKRFPYPEFVTDSKWNLVQTIVPLFMLFSFSYTFSNSVRFVAVEKEKQLKEAMKIMGLPNWMHWLSWFIRTMTMLTISVILIVILLKFPWFGAPRAVFPHSNGFLLLVFLLTFCISLTTFSFLLSTFFSKAKSAVTGATIAWYLSFIPFFMTDSKYDEIPGFLRILLCIFPNTAMVYGVKLIIRNEEMGDGLNWSTMWRPLNVYDSLTVGTSFVFLLLSSIVFIILTLYIESIFPGSYGVAKPWYFPFTKQFWCRSQNRSDYQPFEDRNDQQFFNDTPADPGNFEEEPTNEYAGVEIKNLCKTFGNKSVAVSNLSMKMYNNQITALLGHNGAGKTTTFSMLTGMIEPTSGTALINGYDIRTDIDMARGSMGFCPQHNILFDELTVREHILFYSRLKGLSSREADEEVKKYVRLLELESKVDAISETLSGGMKRKLSIGIALCGNSKVVFCDEPTSGMDAAARRSLWNVLLEEKKDRVIVLTTHFMDEADVLGDRIAIMARGGLKCFGSSFFLKKRFGTGYHLICEKNFNCNSDFVTGLLHKYLPELQIESENESEISYLLPEEQVILFQQMFTDLERNEENLNLKSYGVSLTTMEEIFMKFGKDTVRMEKTKIDSNSSNATQYQAIEINAETQNASNNTTLLKGAGLLCNQAKAMIKKRFLCWLRSWKSFLLYNFVVFIILAPTIFEGLSFSKKLVGLPPFDITLDAYQKPITLIQESNNSVSSRILQQYQENIWTHSEKTKVVTTTEDVESFLLNLGKDSLQILNFQYVTAVSAFSNGTILAWFNNQLYHTASLGLNLVHNAIVRDLINSEHSIQVTNAPFNFRVPPNSTNVDEMPISIFGISLTIALGISIPFVSASYIMFYIQEKECRAKFMQYVSGMNLSVFWITSILWDVFTNMSTVVMILIMLLFCRHDFWKDLHTLGIITMLLLMYNVAMMPIVCLASLIFTKPTTGVNVFSFCSIVISVAFSVNILLGYMHKAVKALVMIYPSCSLINGFVKLSKIDEILSTCEKICEATNCNRQSLCIDNPDCCPNLIISWGENSISPDLLYMLLTSIGATLLLLLIEHGFFGRIIPYLQRLRGRKLPVIDTEEEPLDDDVSDIRDRINAMTISELQDQNLILRNVSKFYGSFLAVNQVSLDIKQAECFGLLGNNGAGKTSIFKMLTGEESISSGEAFLHGLNMKSKMHKIYKTIGYCPQFDALFDNLTAREILEIFALLRGVPQKDVISYAVQSATDLDLIDHVDKKVSQLSGGNKRKLSTAIALVGNPMVIFLDEPTTGMDPATKRNLWNIIIKLRDQGKSIVLTSHSMEECEALCTQLTIMVNGNCKCYGSSQHLKNKFTRGFELKVKVRQESDETRVKAVKNYIANAFDEATLTEEHQDLLTYTIPSGSLKWSAVFGLMENGKKTQDIVDYSVSQNSLEQVLLSFVKSQRAYNNPKQGN